MPCNGINPHSVVLFDNCSIQHVPEVVKSIQDVGALLHFLPPYSPDFAPIEETFSKVKQAMKSIEKENTYTSACESILLQSFLEVTPEDCQGWIKDCGIYNACLAYNVVQSPNTVYVQLRLRSAANIPYFF